MWHRLLICAGCLASVALALGVLSSGPANALAGCCKQANEDGSWEFTDLSIEECESQNEEDGDNVLKEAGSWWWDISC